MKSSFVGCTKTADLEFVVEHRASIEPLDGRVSPDGLLRVSVGLENANDSMQLWKQLLTEPMRCRLLRSIRILQSC
jgi:cystathionine beta-lyase/cystathionine gamma-synthase